jgi:hypothetical protein
MWYWQRKEGISWTYSVRNIVLHRVQEERNIPQTIIRRKNNWIGLIIHGNCLTKHITKRKIQGTTEVAGRSARRHTQLLDDSNERRQC